MKILANPILSTVDFVCVCVVSWEIKWTNESLAKQQRNCGRKTNLFPKRNKEAILESLESTIIYHIKELLPLLLWLLGLCKTGETSDISQPVEYLKAKSTLRMTHFIIKIIFKQKFVKYQLYKKMHTVMAAMFWWSDQTAASHKLGNNLVLGWKDQLRPSLSLSWVIAMKYLDKLFN